MELVLLLDLDETLFVRTDRDDEAYDCVRYEHLTLISSEGADYFFIHLDATAGLFKYLIEINIKIGFITAGSYTAEEVLPVLRKAYGLAATDLQNCIFVNAKEYGDRRTPKGKKIHALKQLNILSKDSRVILVDDNLSHLKSARMYGCYAIHATGHFVIYNVELKKRQLISNGSKYLNEIRILVDDLLQHKSLLTTVRRMALKP